LDKGRVYGCLSTVLKNQRTQAKKFKELVKEPTLNYWFFAKFEKPLTLWKFSKPQNRRL
jgi:hypothetical protein